MNQIKVIKTEQDYAEALKLVENLINLDPDPNSAEGEQLNLLGTLIQDYESAAFPTTLPNPIDAIKFRMEQANLKPADLIPYIGSRSRVSEILSGKRQLTLEMVRVLEASLGIPAKVLIQKVDNNIDSQYQHWDNALIKVMAMRGYFGDISIKNYDKSKLLNNFFSKIGLKGQPVILLRKGSNYRTAPLTDKNALSAWSVRVLQKADKIKLPVKYKYGVVDLAFMQKLVKLSTQEKSPLIVQEYLKKYGIKVIIEPHLPKTRLDGAVLLKDKDNPVIGLTLRYDRLDSFWFTLMHELAHISLHYDNQDFNLFYDELEKVKGLNIDPMEKSADNFAGEALVPSSKWEISPARLIPSPIAAQSLADELGIHVAIVAGIMGYEHKNYYYLNKIVNNYKVKQYFQ